MSLPKTLEIFDINHTIAKELLKNTLYPYEALGHIKDFICEFANRLSNEFDVIGEDIYIAKGVKIYPTATIEGPTIICKGTKIRPGAFIRGSVIIGERCVIGNSTEIKNSIVFDDVQIPHYNYVGDSIMGYKSHMGASAIASNYRLDHSSITLTDGEKKIDTGFRKLGVMLGDFSEVGCGSILNPGTIVGRETLIYPLTVVRGIIPPNSNAYASVEDLLS